MRRQKGTEEIFEAIMTEDFPKLVNSISINLITKVGDNIIRKET